LFRRFHSSGAAPKDESEQSGHTDRQRERERERGG